MNKPITLIAGAYVGSHVKILKGAPESLEGRGGEILSEDYFKDLAAVLVQTTTGRYWIHPDYLRLI